MSKQVITVSDRAAERVKEIIASAKEPIIGVRVGVASGGCAGMSYVMEYAKNTIQKQLCIFLVLRWIIKKKNYRQHLYLKILTKLSVVDVVNLLRSNSILPHNHELYIIVSYERY